jgi:hypothetical protein
MVEVKSLKEELAQGFKSIAKLSKKEMQAEKFLLELGVLLVLKILTLKNTLQEAQTELQNIEVKLKKVETDFQILVAYWGEDPKSTQPEEFFSIFITFTSAFEVDIDVI